MVRILLAVVLLSFPFGGGAMSLEPTEGTMPEMRREGGPWAIVAGLLHQVEESARQLRDEHRGPAMDALNRALRLAEVASSAGHGLSLSAANDGLKTIKDARHAIQNGDPHMAETKLSEGAGRLRTLIELGLREDAKEASDSGWRGRKPKAEVRVLDIQGRRIGEIDRIVQSDGEEAAIIETGSWINVLGFLDLGGRKRTVPVSDLVFGEHMAVLMPLSDAAEEP